MKISEISVITKYSILRFRKKSSHQLFGRGEEAVVIEQGVMGLLHR
jgi:hypothetical protein